MSYIVTDKVDEEIQYSTKDSQWIFWSSYFAKNNIENEINPINSWNDKKDTSSYCQINNINYNWFTKMTKVVLLLLKG